MNQIHVIQLPAERRDSFGDMAVLIKEETPNGVLEKRISSMGEYMDKLIDKLGLYDIWATIYPGGVFLILIKTLYYFMSALKEVLSDIDGIAARLLLICRANIYVPDTLQELLVFFVLSYVTGSVLHEMGSMFKHRVLYRAGKPTDFLLESNRGLFSGEEVKRLRAVYRELMGTSVNDGNKENLALRSRVLFHAINTTLQIRKISSQYAKLNVIHNTCLTMSVALILNFGVVLLFDLEFLILGRYDWILPTISIAVALGIGIVVLIKRSTKYYNYWVRNIVLAYLELDREGSLKAEKYTNIILEEDEP